MLNFIQNIWNTITGDINAVRNWVLSIISAVYSYFDRMFNSLEQYAFSVWRETENLFNQAWGYITQVYNYAVAIVEVWGRNLISWVTGIWNDVYTFAKGVYGDLVKWVDYLTHAIETGLRDLTNWIIANVWNPLKADVTQALDWIFHEGAFVYSLLTHPDKLASLLGSYLWHTWLSLLAKSSPVIGRWLRNEMIKLVGPLATIIEDILSAFL